MPKPVRIARRGLQAILESQVSEDRLLAVAEVGADEARRRCKVDTGATRDSIQASSEPGRAAYSYSAPQGTLQEFGFTLRDGRKVPANPFMRGSVDAMRAAVR